MRSVTYKGFDHQMSMDQILHEDKLVTIRAS